MARLTDAKVAAIKLPLTGQDEHPDDLVTGLRLRVGAGGRKAWIVRTRAGGKPINKTLGTYPVLRLSDAREAARTLLRDIALNGAPRQAKTFGELADHWIEHVAKPNNRSWDKKRALSVFKFGRQYWLGFRQLDQGVHTRQATDELGVGEAVGAVLSSWGRIDLLVNNAGSIEPAGRPGD